MPSSPGTHGHGPLPLPPDCVRRSIVARPWERAATARGSWAKAQTVGDGWGRFSASCHADVQVVQLSPRSGIRPSLASTNQAQRQRSSNRRMSREARKFPTNVASWYGAPSWRQSRGAREEPCAKAAGGFQRRSRRDRKGKNRKIIWRSSRGRGVADPAAASPGTQRYPGSPLALRFGSGISYDSRPDPMWARSEHNGAARAGDGSWHRATCSVSAQHRVGKRQRSAWWCHGCARRPRTAAWSVEAAQAGFGPTKGPCVGSFENEALMQGQAHLRRSQSAGNSQLGCCLM